jgi:O-antigen/teichoic acid export membrane protein
MIRRNLSWLAVSQAARLISGLFIGTWLTRTLGPEQNGLFGTALVISSLVAVAAEMGLRQVLIRQLAVRKQETAVIFGTAARLMLASGLGWMVLAAGFAAWWGGPDLLIIGLVFFSTVPLTAYVAVLSRWDASGQAQRTAKLNLLTNLIASTARVACILSDAPILWAAATVALESWFVATVVLSWTLKQGWGCQWLAWDKRIARELLRESIPLFIALSGTILLLRVDQLMVFHISGATEAGIYAAATRLSEIVYATGPIMTATFMPILSVAHTRDPARYIRLRRSLFGVMSLLAFASMIGWFLFGRWTVNQVYGDAYDAAYPVLSIHVIAALPYLHGELRGSLLVVEQKTVWSIVCAVAGLILNVLFNLWLIPSHGAVGAAYATAIAYVIVWFLASLALPALRSIGKQQAAALFSPFRLAREIRELKETMS